MSGWIKLHRQFIKWEWFTDVNTCHLFQYLLLEANHKETKWRGRIIMPGQLLTGRKKLSENTGLSERNIRTSLDKLKSTSEVTSKTFSKYSIITITNWDKYQQIDQQPTSIASSNRPATDQQPTTSNNVKNIKNENKEKKEGENFILPLPEWLPLDDWNDYLKSRKKKATNRAKQLLIIKLDELRSKGNDPGAVLRQSIMNGWTSLIEIKEQKNGSKTGFAGEYRNDDRKKERMDSNRGKLMSAIFNA